MSLIKCIFKASKQKVLDYRLIFLLLMFLIILVNVRWQRGKQRTILFFSSNIIECRFLVPRLAALLSLGIHLCWWVFHGRIQGVLDCLTQKLKGSSASNIVSFQGLTPGSCCGPYTYGHVDTHELHFAELIIGTSKQATASKHQCVTLRLEPLHLLVTNPASMCNSQPLHLLVTNPCQCWQFVLSSQPSSCFLSSLPGTTEKNNTHSSYPMIV